MIMKRILLIIALVAAFVVKANAWVYTTTSWDADGYGVLETQPFKLDFDNNNYLKFQIKAVYDIAKDNWYYYLKLVEKNKIGSDQAWYPKGAIFKIRTGSENVYDLATTKEYKWDVYTVVETDHRDGIDPAKITGVSNVTKVDDIVVTYPATKEMFDDIAENGLMKFRRERNTNVKYDDFNFTEKQIKSSAKELKKHYKNLLDQQSKMLKQIEKWRQEGSKKKKRNTKPVQQEIGEF